MKSPYCCLQVLIFAGSVEEGLGLRLFLESFGLRLGCLHAELPVNSRSHILASFNKGLFDFLIAVGELAAEINQLRLTKQVSL
jgi:ATP-dependent RNA helicase DDX56/DBP9